MGLTGDPHHILTRKLIKKHFLFLFFGRRWHDMCHLLWLAIISIIYCITWCFSLKKSRQKNSHNQNRRFLFSLLSHDLLLLIFIAWFSHSSQHSVFGQCAQILSFLRACDGRVCASFGLLIFASGQVWDSRMACQTVMIVQDFRETGHFACGIVFLVYRIAIHYGRPKNQFKYHLSIPFYRSSETCILVR